MRLITDFPRLTKLQTQIKMTTNNKLTQRKINNKIKLIARETAIKENRIVYLYEIENKINSGEIVLKW